MQEEMGNNQVNSKVVELARTMEAIVRQKNSPIAVQHLLVTSQTMAMTVLGIFLQEHEVTGTIQNIRGIDVDFIDTLSKSFSREISIPPAGSPDDVLSDITNTMLVCMLAILDVHRRHGVSEAFLQVEVDEAIWLVSKVYETYGRIVCFEDLHLFSKIC